MIMVSKKKSGATLRRREVKFYQFLLRDLDKMELVKASLSALLTSAIDYAGMYPPAKLPIAEAANEYLDLKLSGDSWLVDHFVVGSNKLGELESALRQQAADRDKMPEVSLSVVGTALTDGASAVKTLERDISRVVDSAYEVGGFELKVPSDQHMMACLRAVKKSGLLDMDIPVYLEFGWGSDMGDAFYEAISVLEEVGFKARMGGIEAGLFPNVDEVADFLVTMVSLDMPFKFTAGLHEPLRYEDTELGVWRHGFLNAILAGSLAFSQELSHKEVVSVLEITDGKTISFEDSEIRVGEHKLFAEDIEDFWQSFGGFGSCSVLEPVAGLKRLGYL